MRAFKIRKFSKSLFTTLNEPALEQNTKQKNNDIKNSLNIGLKFIFKQNYNLSQKYIQISIICVYFEIYTEFSMYRKPSNNAPRI